MGGQQHRHDHPDRRPASGPGNGALVRLVAEYAEREPEVAGKPMRPLFEETLTRVGGEHPLVVGDRLDTDIEGAVTMGWDSLLVLTGVTGLDELVRARPEERPTYIAPDLAALAEAQPAPEETDGRASSWAAGPRRSTAGSSASTARGSAADWWRVVAVAAWPISTRPGSLSRPTACSLPCSVSAMSESFVNPIFGVREEPATRRRGRGHRQP